ncbi:fibronectin type 3 and ankyrin repeat domains protein 1-like [Cloeon dipterum]|uniref:fibronectin type 3 and ankyrin repeat domains protein 1-like n=1 Tax=Cloeon dipterum TaxID=197152 RepID=UPI00321F854B
MRRIAFAVRAIKLQKHVSGEKKPLTPYVEASATTLNSLQLAWHLNEAQRKLAETKGAKFTSLLEMCDPETLDWQPVYRQVELHFQELGMFNRGNECNCSVEELAPSTVYLFRLKVFESEDQESNIKWSECISGQTRDEPPSAKSLHKEIEFGNHQEVSRILQIIPIAASSCASDAGLTSLQTAVLGSDLKMVKMLLQHCDIDAKSIGNGRTALMMACAAGKADVAEYLLENGANIEKQDRIGMTALHHSLLHARMVKLILDAGAAVDAADSCGWTPLMRAGNLI